MADRGRSTYLRPPTGDPVDPRDYSLREASVRGAARCVAAGMDTWVPPSLRDDVLAALRELQVEARAEEIDGDIRIRKAYS